MSFKNGGILITPQLALHIIDALDEREKLINDLRTKSDNSKNQDIESKLKKEIEDLKKKVNELNSKTQSDKHGLIDPKLREQSCIDFMQGEKIIDIEFIESKIEDIELLRKLNDDSKKESKRESKNISDEILTQAKEKMLKSQRNLLIGEYYFNNMLAKNMAEYYCDRILY
jgi:hypothetical protein